MGDLSMSAPVSVGFNRPRATRFNPASCDTATTCFYSCSGVVIATAMMKAKKGEAASNTRSAPTSSRSTSQQRKGSVSEKIVQKQGNQQKQQLQQLRSILNFAPTSTEPLKLAKALGANIGATPWKATRDAVVCKRCKVNTKDRDERHLREGQANDEDINHLATLMGDV